MDSELGWDREDPKAHESQTETLAAIALDEAAQAVSESELQTASAIARLYSVVAAAGAAGVDENRIAAHSRLPLDKVRRLIADGSERRPFA